jgi:trimeric autotransporter adhesin
VFNMIHGMGAVFIGVGASAVDTGAAVGDQSTASQAGSAAYGFGANASATNATALGANSVASGVSSLAAGNGAQASATSSVALGNGASATAANSVALGSGSVASTPNTVSVGSVGNERRVTNVAAGFAPTDAATMGQVNDLDRRAQRGIAAAVAMASSTPPLAPGQSGLTLGSGFYRGQGAASVNFAHRFNSTTPVYFSAGYSNGGGTEHAGRAAVSFVW